MTSFIHSFNGSWLGATTECEEMLVYRCLVRVKFVKLMFFLVFRRTIDLKNVTTDFSSKQVVVVVYIIKSKSKTRKKFELIYPK